MKARVFLVSAAILAFAASLTYQPAEGYEPNVLLSESGITALRPAITSDELGVYLVWHDKGSGDYDVLFLMSRNNGTTFSESVIVNDNPGDDNHSTNPDVAVGNGRTCVVWEDSRNVASDIYFSKSHDGKSFSQDVAVWRSDTNSSRTPSIAIDALNDLIYVAWVDNLKEIKLSVSSDGGLTFSDPVIVSDSRKNERYDPQVDVNSNGKVYVAWADGRTGLVPQGPFNVPDTDIFISNSTDSGQTFSPNLRVNKEYKEILQAHPSLAIDGSDILHLVWDDELGFGEPSVLYSSSPDGLNFSDPVFVNFTSPVVDGVGTTHQTPVIDVSKSGDVRFVSWAESRSGDFNIYLARSDGEEFYPAVSLFGGNYFSDDILSRNGYRDPGEAVILDDGNGRLDPGTLNGSDSSDKVILAGKANLQEDLLGDRLLYFDENSDGWDFDDDIVLESPIITYPSIEPKVKSELDNTTGNFVNYLRLIDGFYYVVEKSERMSIGWFDIAHAKDAGINPENFGLKNDDPVSRAEISITYKTDSAYDGTSSVYVWKPPSENMSLFTIQNTGGAQQTETIDLLSLGFLTIPDLKLVNVSYENNASSISNVSFNKISLWIDRGLPNRFDTYDFRVYDGTSPLSFNDALTSFIDEDNVMFVDSSMDGYYGLGEPLVVTPVDINPGGQFTSAEMILPRADRPHWDLPFSPFPVNDDAGSSSQYSPSIAADSGGGCYVVWEDNRGFPASIYFADTVTDSWSPYVLHVSPADGSSDVLLDSEIRMVFSEPMDVSSVETSFSIFPPTAGVWNWSSEREIAVFRPLSGLLPSATYYLEIPITAYDILGNPLKDRVHWKFLTATPPSIECSVNSSASTGSDVQVTCDVADLWGVVSVMLFYKGIGDEDFTHINMSLVSGTNMNGLWRERIPAQTSIGRVRFFVTAENLIGAIGRYPVYGNGTVRIMDIVPPSLEHDIIESASAGSTVNITAIATDDMGIESVVLYAKPIGGTVFVPFEMRRVVGTDEYYVEMEIPYENGRLEYYLKVTDVGGNEVTMPEANPQSEPNVIRVSGAIDEAYFWIGLSIFFSVLIVILAFFFTKRMRAHE